MTTMLKSMDVFELAECLDFEVATSFIECEGKYLVLCGGGQTLNMAYGAFLEENWK